MTPPWSKGIQANSPFLPTCHAACWLLRPLGTGEAQGRCTLSSFSPGAGQLRRLSLDHFPWGVPE